MKILRIIYDFPPPWEGLAPFPYELSLAQVKQGHQVTVICGHWPKAEPKLPSLPEGLRLIRIPREPFASTLFLTTAPLAFFIVLRELIFGHYDLIQGHGQLPIYYHVFRLLTWGLKQPPYQLFLHITAVGRRLKSQESKETIKPLTKYLEWPLHEFSDGLGCAIADKIFVTGENVRQEAVQHYHVDENKIVVLENGVNPDIFSPQGADHRQGLGYEDGDNVILYVGAHNERKGIDKIIRTLPLLTPNFKLLTIGKYDELFKSKLDSLAEELGVQDRVQLLGYLPYPVADYQRTANIFVIPSSYEGFPKVILEALATGIPVIASGFAVRDPLSGLRIVDETTPEILAKAIEEQITTQVDVNLIKEKYSWSTLAKTTLTQPNSP